MHQHDQVMGILFQMDHKSSFRKDSVNSVESMDTSSCPADEEKTYEYETQHFGFTPKAFCDGGKYTLQ